VTLRLFEVSGQKVKVEGKSKKKADLESHRGGKIKKGNSHFGGRPGAGNTA